MLRPLSRGGALRRAFALALLPAAGRSQEASESFEREARKDFNQGRFKQAAVKFERAADAASDGQRRARMRVQEAWSHFNARAAKDAREALVAAYSGAPRARGHPGVLLPGVHEARRRGPFRVPRRRASARRRRRDAPDGEGAAEGRAGRGGRPRSDVQRPARQAGARRRGAPRDGARAPGEVRRGGPDPRERRTRGRVPASAPVPASPAPPPPSAPATVSGSPPAAAGAVSPLPRPGPGIDYLALGRAALVRGDSANAQAAANRQLEIEPSSSEAYRILGEAYLLRSATRRSAKRT